MTENEKKDLLNNYEYYKTILEIHRKNKDRLWENEKEYQNYVNDILDQMLQIRKRLEEDK